MVLEWMFWTPQTAVLFGLVGLGLLILAILDHYRRSEPRKGFLPIPTTRGDRFFWGILLSAIFGILYLWFVPLPVEWGIVPMVAIFIITFFRG